LIEILKIEEKRWINLADVDALLFERDKLNELDKTDLKKFNQT
jgi:hypothetical protein